MQVVKDPILLTVGEAEAIRSFLEAEYIQLSVDIRRAADRIDDDCGDYEYETEHIRLMKAKRLTINALISSVGGLSKDVFYKISDRYYN